MAFPFLSECGFEDGTRGHFDSETDVSGRLDFPHYTELARLPSVVGMPYRGAYCLRVQLGITPTVVARVSETGSWDTALGGTIFVRFMFRLSTDLVMADGDEFSIFQLANNVNQPQAAVYINYTTANGVRVGIGTSSASSFAPLTLGVWHCFEMKAVIDSGAGNDGTIDAWLDNGALTQITGLDQTAIDIGFVGSIGQDAGTTAGTLLIDEIVADDARIYPPVDRFPQQLLLTSSGHVFVGPGEIEKIELLSGAATDNVLSVYDTDRAYTLDASSVKVELKNVANNERVAMADFPVRLQRGCYVVLSGTNPRALVKIKWANTYSAGAMRSYAVTRAQNAFGA